MPVVTDQDSVGSRMLESVRNVFSSMPLCAAARAKQAM